MTRKEDALDYHSRGRKGKLEVVPTKPLVSQIDLSLAYTPGVAEPCLEIEKDEGVHFERTWLDPVRGKAFCLATGPTREAVIRIHERAGHPVSEIYELLIEA